MIPPTTRKLYSDDPTNYMYQKAPQWWSHQLLPSTKNRKLPSDDQLKRKEEFSESVIIKNCADTCIVKDYDKKE